MPVFETQTRLAAPWAEMWQNPEADATVLNSMLISKYGEESLDWDPVTIRLEISDDFGVSPADAVMNKICAMQVVMSGSAYFDRVDAFLNISNTLADGDPFFQVMTKVEPEEIAWGLATVGMNRDMLPFSPTIQAYVKAALKDDGYADGYPPIFSSVFSVRPSSAKIRGIVSGTLPTAAMRNSDNISSMLGQNVASMFSQFNKLPGLTSIDENVLEKGILRALDEDADEEKIPTGENG